MANTVARKANSTLDLRLLLACLVLSLWASASAAAEWEDPLRGMPLRAQSMRVFKMEPVKIVFASFQSNGIIKATVFLPKATDQLYFFDQGELKFPKQASLGDAIRRLSEKTSLKAAFRAPFLLIYSEGDRLEIPEAPLPADGSSLAQGQFIDRDWERLQPELQKRVPFAVLPKPESPEAWHFYRACFAGWNLTARELAQAMALGANTRIKAGSSSELRFELAAP